MDRTFIQSSEIKKICPKHGEFSKKIVFLRNNDRDSHCAYCPLCVEELLLKHLKPLWEVIPHKDSLSFEKDN